MTKLPGKSSGKGRLYGIIALFLLILIGAVAAGGWLIWQEKIIKAMAVPGSSLVVKTFTVKPGSGAGTIARQLEAEGLVSRAQLFRIKSKLAGEDVTLKAGEYRIAPHASINDVFSLLQSGKIVQHAVTVPEGRTVREIIEIVRASPVLSGAVVEVPPEGSLLPETYAVTRGTDRKALLVRMQGDMNAVLDQAWEGRDPNLPLASKKDMLILASIVEKETGIAAERPQVAAVFVNRLRRRMRLESDPTILYGINGGIPLGRGLRRSEIDRKTAWNTYQIDGLPPTPICNPGRDAIMAVAHPAQTKDLYFVANGIGGHVFAPSYRAHLRNVAQWRKVERQRKRERARK
ncbi:MAG: aminodeoxychorismate lyase [Robiginitomaculum sp.]|nr:MAG: aminodeoxychorismate lyase [Robiginitomaculum sp.]